MLRKTFSPEEMSLGEYLAILSEFYLNRSWAGRVLARSEVTGRRWCSATRMPDSAAIVLRLIRARVITIPQVIDAKKSPRLRRAMGWREYKDILEELGLSRSWVGRTLANSNVTGRRWGLKSETTRLPESAAIVLRLMQAGLVTMPEVMAAKQGPLPARPAQPPAPLCESQIT